MLLCLTRCVPIAARISNAQPRSPYQPRKTPRLLRFPTTTSMADLPPDRRPLVISGPSGVGKGTLLNLLRERHPETFTLSVSHTTRQPRQGEAHGVHYYFVSPEEFDSMVAQDAFIEHARFGGNRYGTSKQTIRDQRGAGKVVVLDIEMEGVKQLQKSDIDARYVFIAPPSEEELEKRLRGRGTEKEDNLLKRLEQAKHVVPTGQKIVWRIEVD